MSTKTSQLQIRVSPEEKAALKRLAAEAGVSVSSFVLAQVLPSTQQAFNRRARALANAASRPEALADLTAFLAALEPEELPVAVAGADLADLPVVAQNYAAAAVESQAYAKGQDPPAWTERVALPDRPAFAWELRSLRPHLLRITPVAYKRRHLFVSVPGSPGAARPARPRAPAGDAEARLFELDAELEGTGIEVELCLVGGAQMPLVFAYDPPTRRPTAMFGPRSALGEAVAGVSRRLGYADEWEAEAVKRVLEASGDARSRMFIGQRLRVFAPPPGYVLALRCAELAFAPDPDADALDADLLYLLRFLDVRASDEALHIVSSYLNERQRPDDLGDRLARLLPR